MFTLKRPARIYPKVAAESFLERLKDCALQISSYEIVDEQKPTDRDDTASLELSFPHHDQHSRVSVVFAAFGNRAETVEVEVKADNWVPALDYKAYSSTIREVVQPVLNIYNRSYGTWIRLGVPGPAKPARLPKEADRLFRRYLAQASRGYAHALDWAVFYDFILHCHDFRVALVAEELKDLILASGFAETPADELAEVYRHGRALLKRRISPRWPM